MSTPRRADGADARDDVLTISFWKRVRAADNGFDMIFPFIVRIPACLMGSLVWYVIVIT
jgi:hypothetical protein